MALERKAVDVVVATNGVVATNALAGECRVSSIRLQVHSPPASISPAAGGGILLTVLDHELNLDEAAWASVAISVDLLGPCGFGEGSALWPRIDLMFRNGMNGNIVAEDDAQGVVIETVGGTDDLRDSPKDNRSRWAQERPSAARDSLESIGCTEFRLRL